MKATKRLILAVVSSFFFAVGLTRAAERFDPISQRFAKPQQNASVAPSDDCTSITLLVDDLS